MSHAEAYEDMLAGDESCEEKQLSYVKSMENVAEKVDTHIVIKKEDALKYLEETEQIVLEDMLNKISQGRANDKKKPNNHYYICNEDEPYADIVRGVILGGEAVKANGSKRKQYHKINQFIDNVDKITKCTQEQSQRIEDMQKTLQSINSSLDYIEMSIH